jgi:hypothetical protein
MKKLLLLSSIAFLAACGTDTKESNGKIKLELNPEKDKAVKINYSFSVNSVSNGDITNFEMQLSGTGEKNEDGTVTIELKNDNISMSGTLQGKEIKGSATGPDSVTGDAKLVAMPVFAFQGKIYRSVFTPQFDKKSEVEINMGEVGDSTENKMQFFIHYPNHEVAVGDTWEKELSIKSGSKMSCSAKYTLKELNETTATISIDGKLYGKGESFGNEFTMDGTLTGTIIVSLATGWPTDTNINQDFTLHMGGKDLPMKYGIKEKVE